MKKILALLLPAIAIFVMNAKAQPGTSCDAGFDYYTFNNYEASFYPAYNPDSASVSHQWDFGNGSTPVVAYGVQHTYSGPGTFTVTHTVKRYTANGTLSCEKALTKNIIILAPPIPCTIVSNFSFRRDSIQTNKVYFTNLTLSGPNIGIIKWGFGDGTYSTENNPAHIYSASGLYNVCLTVNSNSACTDDTCRLVQVQVSDPALCNLTAYFSSHPDSVVLYKMHFSNLSNPLASADSVSWSFGDGSYSTDINPAHTYHAPGTYTVCIRIKKSNAAGIVPCVKEFCKTVVVNEACNLHADFTYRKDSLAGTQPYTYLFQSQINSSGIIDSTSWDFGDGSTVLVNIANPVHAFAAPGTYIVCLTVKQQSPFLSGSPCVSRICKTIIVGQQPLPCNFTAYFSWKADSLNHRKIYFTNQTQPPITTSAAQWTFGDGTGSNGWNADHIYTHAGSYTVCLKVRQNDTCVKEFCKEVIIDSTTPPNTCTLIANYGFKRDSIQTNKVYFTNLTLPAPNIDVVKWSFGDGTYSYENNPVHVFAVSGVYNVCLLIKRTNTCSDDTCHLVQVQVPTPLPCNLTANFSYQADPLYPKQIHFINLSAPLSSIDSVSWSFGDGHYSTGINPAHTYDAAGNYTVCIRIKKNNTAGIPACIKEYCHVIAVKDSCYLNVDFTYRKDSISGISFNTYHFINTSSPVGPADSSFWNFGDGTPVVINKNDPLHVFSLPGTYIVCLTVKKGVSSATNLYCTKQICKTIIVVGQPPVCNLNPGFSWKADPLHHNKIFFTNLSSPVTTAAATTWSFGDGTGSNGWNADHLYLHAGTYTICLKVTTSNTCSKEICKTIIVDSIHPVDSCHLQVSFTTSIAPCDNKKVLFTNTTLSSSITNASWSFGDGSFAHTWNAEHQYAQPGKYIVCLKVQAGQNCISYKCDTVAIAPPSINCDNFFARYEYRKDTYLPNKVYFFAGPTPASVQQIWVITKAFSNSLPVFVHQNNPVYIFKDTGYYTICLVAVAAGGCVKECCKTIRIESISTTPQCVLQAYPNPAHTATYFNLQLAQPEKIKIAVYNLQNVLVTEETQQGAAGNYLVKLNVAALSTGFYSIRIVYGNNVCYSRFQKL